MAKIEIYARIRPTQRQYSGIKVTTDLESDCEHINLKTGFSGDGFKTQSSYSRPHSSDHNFQFKQVFQASATQEEVFNKVSKNIIISFLGGYNGTIFAYGQTSSGKTHTIEGSGRKFADRGIIPRTLSYIYQAVEKRSSGGEDISVNISYMEIYQDTGYDLLNPGMRPGALMVTLPKINIAEGPTGEVIVRNLSAHLAATEEVAQSLLFQGSTCRKVAETSMNQCSSRSHSIFIITLTAQSLDSQIITKSKLNLVDLAGSERVSKTGLGGRILQEAKHINLSLHHLEHVIVTLQHQTRQSISTVTSSPSTSRSGSNQSTRRSREKGNSLNSPQKMPHTVSKKTVGTGYGSQTPSRNSLRPGTSGTHIPYRNCMLTMVLKDSLGGNCLTAMVATVSAEEDNIWETISTCRFSQRVACISNKAKKNEELDDKAVIKKLREQVVELEKEVSELREGPSQSMHTNLETVSLASSQPLTPSDKALCHQILYGFFHGKVENPVAAGIDTAAKFQECLKVLKLIVLQALDISPQLKSQNTEHNVEMSSEVNGQAGLQSNAATTPSPNSRLSSGFGSLVDEDGLIACESSQNKDQLRHGHGVLPATTIQKQITIQSQSLEYAPSVKEQLRKQRKHHKQRKETTRMADRDLSPGGDKKDVLISHTDVNYADSKSKKMSSPALIASVSPIQSDHPPRYPYQAWMSPVAASVTSTGRSGSFDKSPLSMSNDVHCPPEKITLLGADVLSAKPLSPRDERAIRRLNRKHIQLERSRNDRKKLETEMQRLDLHVEQEQIRCELEQIEEKLAHQHALVSRTQKTQSDREFLYSEKLAEQQLQIKQANVYQRLVDVQYQIQSSSHLKESEPVNSLPSSPIYKSMPSNKVQSELEKHKLKETQVNDEIEKLKMSQMEKHLELKEASTRRKILALKQQLKGNMNPVQNPMAVQVNSTSTTRAPLQSTSTSEGRYPASLTAPTPGIRQTVRDTDGMLKSKNHHFGSSINGEFESIHKRHSSACPSGQRLDAGSHAQIGTHPLSISVEEHKTTSKSPSINVNPCLDVGKPKHSSTVPQAHSTVNQLNTTHETIADGFVSSASKVVNRVPESLVKESRADTNQLNSQQSSKAAPRANTLIKLTLPEEIKETEYMSALQRQKARVSRIRRCIIAATVIQRVWRNYRRTLQ